MAIYPYGFQGKETLQPGARGETFQSDLPGFRGHEDRINRTNMNLSTSEHDVPNIKWELDRRLPVLFRYGYAIGYNQLVMPKGRIVGIDPHMNQLDFDMKKSYNVLTLANGGSVVKLKADKKTWETVSGQYIAGVAGGENVYVSSGIVPTEVITTDANTGKVSVDGVVRNDYITANRPIGIIQRNEYTRDDDAFNGMQPGAVLTDAMVELPLFALKDKAEVNPWGSIYGNILPGDLLKSDENGRFVVSPLSRPEFLDTLTQGQIELERQQVVGQVYQVQRDLLPAGAAKYAQWALSDRMNFDQFNPFMWRGNNRRHEDINERTPYNLDGGGAVSGTKQYQGEDPLNVNGFGFDNTMSQHDLHMLASTARQSDLRFGLEYQLENGIPGLTDGYNAVTRKHDIECVGDIKKAVTVDAYSDLYFKMSEVNVEKGTVEIAVSTKTKGQLVDADFTPVKMAGQGIKPFLGSAFAATDEIKVKYLEELQGFFVIEIADKATFHAETISAPLNIYVRFSKRGLAGVPTFMDWDGCMGFASVLLQK